MDPAKLFLPQRCRKCSEKLKQNSLQLSGLPEHHDEGGKSLILFAKDSLPEWSKGVDSSSTSASCVGSNPTAVTLTTIIQAKSCHEFFLSASLSQAGAWTWLQSMGTCRSSIPPLWRFCSILVLSCIYIPCASDSGPVPFHRLCVFANAAFHFSACMRPCFALQRTEAIMQEHVTASHHQCNSCICDCCSLRFHKDG